MVGILSSVMLAGLLTAGPDGFSFDGPEVTARSVGNVGFFTQGTVPFTDLFERGTGSVELSVRDRIGDPRATYGDSGSLVATFVIAGETYRVEMDRAGFPPAQALSGTVTGTLPPPPAQAIGGGVLLNQDVHGMSGLGFPSTTQVHAVAAVWGVGRVWRNGALLSDTALIYASALSHGAHADDDTFRVLPVARQGDTEVEVLVWNLPPTSEPRGFIQLGFDDVAITVDGASVPSVAAMPAAGLFAGVPSPSTPVPGGSSPASVPSTSSQPQQQQGVGGSGLAGTGQTDTGAVAGTQPGVTLGTGLSPQAGTQQGTPETDITLPGVARSLDDSAVAFENPGRVSTSRPRADQPDALPDGTRPETIPPSFVSPDNTGRVAISVGAPSTPGDFDAQVPGLQPNPLPGNFLNPERQTTSTQLPPTTVSGFVPQTPVQQPTQLSTSGSFSVVSSVPGVPVGSGFAFGGPRLATGVIQTPGTAQSRTVAVPLVSTPQPINAQQPVPLVSTPQPINAQPAVPLIASPPPLNSQPISGTLPGSPASAATAVPGATTPTTTPGLVPPVTGTTGGTSGGAAPSP
ncbi:elastin [Archangium violaceum]|uniref:elastin n=1 Tax=Archangium violaceum TaxID=83451 RepID=UPI00194E574F|nr:elastin [Archangium violaceum]QRN94302.1 elastin [Archangium violaceum]